MVDFEGQWSVYSCEPEGCRKERFHCERMHAKFHMLQDPWQRQQFERSLGHTHLLILESLLEKQKAMKIPPGDIDAGRSHFRDLVCHEDTHTGRHHNLPTQSPAPDLGPSPPRYPGILPADGSHCRRQGWQPIRSSWSYLSPHPQVSLTTTGAHITYKGNPPRAHSSSDKGECCVCVCVSVSVCILAVMLNSLQPHGL